MKFLYLGCLLLTVSGCANSGRLYQWGNYEKSLKKIYTSKNYNLEKDVQEVSKQLNKIESSGRKVPPGYYAHMGLLQLKKQNTGLAKEFFEKEAIAFPESRHFMQQLINKAN